MYAYYTLYDERSMQERGGGCMVKEICKGGGRGSCWAREWLGVHVEKVGQESGWGFILKELGKRVAGG